MGKIFKSVGKILGFSAPKAPKIPAPEAPPQQAKAADYESQRKRNQRSAATSSTQLSGPKGVDPTSNALGRNTLLGQ